MASTGNPAWGSQPTWSAPELSNPIRKTSYTRDSRYNALTPFSPGSHNVAVEVELIQPIAMHEGSRFAIREGGRTIGAGRITEIIE